MAFFRNLFSHKCRFKRADVENRDIDPKCIFCEKHLSDYTTIPIKDMVGTPPAFRGKQ
jgi:hypothetical protein